MTSYDIAIIGAGPAGLYGTYYAGFRGFSTVLIDALEEPGGQVTAMYPEKDIFDIAGFPRVRGRDLVDGLLSQAEQFNPTIILNTNVEDLQVNDELVELKLSNGQTLQVKAVVITGGIGAFTPRALPVGMEWHGRGLVHFVPSLHDHQGKDVVIVGGGDSAFDWAYSLNGIARSITLVHRRDTFRAHAAMVDTVKNLGVELITNSEVSAVTGSEHIESVEITDKVSGASRVLPCQTLVAALGFVANIGPIANWGIDLDKRRILVNTAMQTNLPRVFAAGDITTYAGKVPLIAVGFGEAATAVNNAAPLIHENMGIFPGHSSGGGAD